MATWEETVLSTDKSIAMLESEINAQAGTKQVSGLSFNGTTKLSFVASLATSVRVYYANGTTATPTVTANIVTPSANAEIIKIEILAGTASFVGSILNLDEGKGTILYDQYYEACGTTDATWSFFNIVRSWNDKITLAKQIIGNKLKASMIKRGVNEVLVQDNGYELLDVIINPEVFGLASDLLTLALCYDDMSGGGTNDYYTVKAKNYMSRFEKAYADAIVIYQIDPTYSGTAIDNANQTYENIW